MIRTSGNGRIARHAAMVATALGLWGALVLLFAAPLALTSRISWREAVRFGGSFWALWLLFLPVVAWLSFRFPIERRNLLRRLGLHLLACLLVVGANRASFRAVAGIFPSPPRADAPGRSPDARTEATESPGQRPRIPNPPPRRPLDLGPPGALSVFLGLRAALDVLVYGSLVGLGVAVTSLRKSEERERRASELEARLTSAQLQALRMQIHPHFLFNTLNSIATLIHVDPQAADEMLADLGELLRHSLDTMEDQEVPLAQELEFIGGYLSIEQRRLGERLRVERIIPEELMNALVPALLLQPLVENAIRHGIEPRRGPGLISILGRREGDWLHLVVQDNGRGLSGSDVSRAGHRGIGLANTRARLEGLYGQDQSLTVRKADPEGCRVEIRLPFHGEPVTVPAVSKPTCA